MNFLDGEYSKAIGQYMVIGVVVSILLTIKYFAMKKSYEKKLDSFVHPDLLLPDIIPKLKKLPNYDSRVLLAQSIRNLETDIQKLRSVSILLALMKSENINIDPFRKRIL